MKIGLPLAYQSFTFKHPTCDNKFLHNKKYIKWDQSFTFEQPTCDNKFLHNKKIHQMGLEKNQVFDHGLIKGSPSSNNYGKKILTKENQ